MEQIVLVKESITQADLKFCAYKMKEWRKSLCKVQSLVHISILFFRLVDPIPNNWQNLNGRHTTLITSNNTS